MPFKSEKQRRYLWANEPKIAREWTDRYGAADGGIMRLNFASGINPEMQKIIATLRENNPGKYDKFTDQELAENFASITATGFNDDVDIYIKSKTGYNAKMIPVFNVKSVGDDPTLSPDDTSLVQVIDCVGKF